MGRIRAFLLVALIIAVAAAGQPDAQARRRHHHGGGGGGGGGVKMPNLVISNFKIVLPGGENEPLPDSLDAGLDVVVHETTKNAGNLATTAPVTFTQYYMSLDATYDATDIPLTDLGGTDPYIHPVGPLKPTETSKAQSEDDGDTKINLGAPAGTYYFIACADVNNDVAESNETDNCLAMPNSYAYDPYLHITRVYVDNTFVEVDFAHDVDGTTLLANGSQFTVSPSGPVVSNAHYFGDSITLTITGFTPGNYTMSIAPTLHDYGGAGVDPSNNAFEFTVY